VQEEDACSLSLPLSLSDFDSLTRNNPIPIPPRATPPSPNPKNASIRDSFFYFQLTRRQAEFG